MLTNYKNTRHPGLLSGPHQKRFGCEMLDQVQHDDFELEKN